MDEIQFPILVREFRKELDEGDRSKDLVFEGLWPGATPEQLDQFLAAMGAPSYLLLPNASRQTVIDRYLKSEGMDAFNEEDEEEKAKLEELLTDHQKFLDGITQHSETNNLKPPQAYTLEVNLDLFRLFSDLDKIYQKRVIVLRDIVNPDATFPTVMSMAMRYGIVLVNVQRLVKETAANGSVLLKTQVAD